MWNDDLYILGVAHAMGNDEMSPPSGMMEDWCVKEYNLFGDPELPMWSVTPEQLEADHVSSIAGATTVTVDVTASGLPVEGARVCLQKGDWKTGDIYMVDYTDGSGQCSFYVNPVSTGTISAVAWARDHICYSGSIEVTDTGLGQGVNPGLQNGIGDIYPSPANRAVTVPFTLASAGHVRVDVYDLSGRLTVTLAEGEMTSGNHSIPWELADSDGRRVPSGIYGIRITAPGWTGTSSVLVVR
jgi:hypothetical protein